MRESKPSRSTIVLGAALAVLLYASGTALAGGPECKVDADCVPLDCCHSTKCTPRGEAPDCTDVACTAECRPGTLDCGGRCICTSDGQCFAKL